MVMKSLKLTLLFVGVILVLSLLGFFAADSLPRYLSWRNLSVQELRAKAERYSDNNPVCLYVVECSSGVPKLKLISDEGVLDMENLKRTVWARRFYGYCEGQTENILVDFPLEVRESMPLYDGRWSFFNDRFITNRGHFQGSAGSRYPWEPCTESKAVWGNAKH